MRQVIRSSFGILTVVAAVARADAPKPTVVIDGTPPDGIAAIGQPVPWTLRQTGGTLPLHYRVRQNNFKTIAEGDLAANATPVKLSAKLDAPGWLYVDVTAPGDKGPTAVASAGVIVAPDKITAAAPKPDDFDAFWAGQIKQLQTVPPAAVEKPVDSETPGVQLFDVTIESVDGTHVHAQLARPDKPGPLPAIAVFQWAGVYPLKKSFATTLAAQGWLVLNVSAHDLPLYEPKAFYDTQAAGPLLGYSAIGNTSRDTSYFRRMLLSDYQALRYLTARPDFDGRTLVLRGESQGGLQAFAMAALYPKVTALIASVPAGCDTMAADAGRASAWPNWSQQNPAASHDAIMNTSRYFDAANFAADVRCPALVALGLRDVTAVPTSVMAAFNRLGGRRELVVMPEATHQQNHERSTAAVVRWLTSLRTTGKAPQ